MRVLGLIPARGGSKGIPRKNLCLLRGKPLLQYTIEAALGARRLARIILSTEDDEIAAFGRRCGVDVPFVRPAELARDDTPMVPVVRHALEWLAARGDRVEAVCLLQPTSPLRRADDIDGAIALLERTGADSVIAFVEVGEKHPARMKVVDADGRVIDPPFAEPLEGQPRQQLPPMYLREGSIYLTRTAVLLEQQSFKGRDCRAWIVPRERAVNIDTPFDLTVAEQMLVRQDSHAAWPARDTREGPRDTARAAPRPTILCAEATDFPRHAAQRLRQAATLIEADLDRGGLLAAVHDADVLWVRLRHRIDAEVLAAAPRLRAIATPTTGLNHLDLEAIAHRGIRVIALRGEATFLDQIRATAEHTIGLMLALLRHVPAAAAHVRDGGWNRDLFKGSELYGKTIGIVGYGRLGRIVARYLAPFDVELLTADPHVTPSAGDPVRHVPLPDLLRAADLVTLHVSLSPETRGFFGRAEFAAMKPGARLINTARGELIDEDALLDALRTGRLGGAALDVLHDERSDGMRDHPLIAYARTHDTLLITPHIGGCAVESMTKAETFLAERLLTRLPEIGVASTACAAASR